MAKNETFEKYIYRRQGLGTYVADQAQDRSRELKLGHARDLIAEAAREAEEAGIPPQNLPDFFQDTLKQLHLAKP